MHPSFDGEFPSCDLLSVYIPFGTRRAYSLPMRIPILICAGLLMSLGLPAEEKTWVGRISDSMCGLSHTKMDASHDGQAMSERECALACVKNGGKYVLISAGQVYVIGNQDFKQLEEYAGQQVVLTGAMDAHSIRVSKIAKDDHTRDSGTSQVAPSAP